jgi:hypothetical protein
MDIDEITLCNDDDTDDKEYDDLTWYQESQWTPVYGCEVWNHSGCLGPDDAMCDHWITGPCDIYSHCFEHSLQLGRNFFTENTNLLNVICFNRQNIRSVFPCMRENGGQYILVFTDLANEVQAIDLQTFRQIVLSYAHIASLSDGVPLLYTFLMKIRCNQFLATDSWSFPGYSGTQNPDTFRIDIYANSELACENFHDSVLGIKLKRSIWYIATACNKITLPTEKNYQLHINWIMTALLFQLF